MSHSPYPDFGDTLTDALTQHGWPAGSVLPANLGPNAGQANFFVLVEVIGGVSGPLEARPAVDLSVFGPSYRATMDLARNVEAWLSESGGRRIVHAFTGVVTVLDDVELQVFREVPWDNSAMRQMTTTATLTVRRGTGVNAEGVPDGTLVGFFASGTNLIPDPDNPGFYLGV